MRALLVALLLVLAGCNQNVDRSHTDTHCMTTEKGSVTIEDCSIDHTSKSHNQGF